MIKIAKQYQKRECICNKDILHPSCEWTLTNDRIEAQRNTGCELNLVDWLNLTDWKYFRI